MRDIVVIGGSVGALQPLLQLLKSLPPTLPATCFVVIHTSPDTPGRLAALLASHTPLPVYYPEDGEEVRPSRVYVAPPDHHLLVKDCRVRVTHGPRENGFRPAVDPLFRTAAREYGRRVIGVILSGGLDDGTRGLAAIKDAGGMAVAQQVEEAFAAGMPASAIRHVAVDHVVPASGLAEAILRLVHEPTGNGEQPHMEPKSSPPERAERGLAALEDGSMHGPPSIFTCPECHGPLWAITNGDLERFTCHVGHSYSPDTLATSMAASLEAALWTALRSLEEHAAFLRRMEDRTLTHGLQAIAEGYGAKARDTEARAHVVRSALVDDMLASPNPPPDPAPPRPAEVS